MNVYSFSENELSTPETDEFRNRVAMARARPRCRLAATGMTQEGYLGTHRTRRREDLLRRPGERVGRAPEPWLQCNLPDVGGAGRGAQGPLSRDHLGHAWTRRQRQSCRPEAVQRGRNR